MPKGLEKATSFINYHQKVQKTKALLKKIKPGTQLVMSDNIVWYPETASWNDIEQEFDFKKGDVIKVESVKDADYAHCFDIIFNLGVIPNLSSALFDNKSVTILSINCNKLWRGFAKN